MNYCLYTVEKGSQLAIVVEGMGRINFGRAIKNFKGLTGSVTLHATVDGDEVTWNLKDWTMRTLPDGYADAIRALERKRDGASMGVRLDTKAGYYRGYFDLRKTGDTFLNLETWGKGQVYVNGHAIGRFWSIGPQQTLYVPGCWLKRGRNEVIALDVIGPRSAKVWGEPIPQLDKLQQEKGNLHNNPGDRPDLNSVTPVAIGTFTATRQWQSVTFTSPARGRYLAIESLGSHGADSVVSVAELYARDAEGKRIDRAKWSVKYADSEDAAAGNHTGEKAFDQQESTWWNTVSGVRPPHLLVIDLESEHTINGIDYLPCITQENIGGIKDYKIYVY